MTPKSRDRNLARLRGLTGAAAGIAFAACGLFAGLAASATRHVFSASTTTATVTATKTVTKKSASVRTPAVVKKKTTTTSQAAPAPTVTVTQSAPVAASGGS